MLDAAEGLSQAELTKACEHAAKNAILARRTQVKTAEVVASMATLLVALAKAGGHILLAGDASLRVLALAERVECHGVLWVVDALRTLTSVAVPRIMTGPAMEICNGKI